MSFNHGDIVYYDWSGPLIDADADGAYGSRRVYDESLNPFQVAAPNVMLAPELTDHTYIIYVAEDEPVQHFYAQTAKLTLNTIATAGIPANAVFEAVYGEIKELQWDKFGEAKSYKNTEGVVSGVFISEGDQKIVVLHEGIPAAPGTAITLTVPGFTGTSWLVENSRYRAVVGKFRYGEMELIIDSNPE